MMQRIYLITIILLLLTHLGYAQSDDEQKILEATNFSVPTSGAFDLLGISPTEVHRPGLTRDIKLDWVINENRLSPNIAIEAQPFWLLFNRNTSLAEYKSSWLNQFLSRINVSLGNNSSDSTRAIAYAVKVNLFTAKDPILDEDLVGEIAKSTTLTELEMQLLLDPENKELQKKVEDETERSKKKASEALKKWEKQYWNASLLEVGMGQVFNYNSDRLDSLSFTNKGYGIWLAGVTGIGKHLMLNAMIKYSKIGEEEIFEYGGNVRYGSSKVNLFFEVLKDNQNDGNFNIAYGVDYRLPNNLVIQASLKTRYDDNFKFNRLLPVIDLNYLMN
jgi:hypothetical protein